MATIKKEKLSPALRNYIELKERKEKQEADSKKTPLMKYMDKAKESGTLLSSADMNEGEDVKAFARRSKIEQKYRESKRKERDAQYENAKPDISFDSASDTVKAMAFARNMPQPTAADRLRNREGVKYTAPQTSVDFTAAAPKNGYQAVANALVRSDLARAKQEEAGRKAQSERIAAARPMEQVYGDLDRLKARREAFEKTEAANDIADAINDLNMREQKELLEANRDTKKSQAEVDAIRADIQKKYAALRKELENSGEYEELNRKRRLLEQELRDSYSKIGSEGDFEQFSRYSTTANSEEHRPIITQSGVFAGTTGYDDWVYEYINKNPEMLMAERNSRLGETDAASAMGYDLSYLQSMTDEEIGIYNYLYAKGGKEKAEEYLDALQSDLYARQRSDSETRYANFAKEHPVLASAASVASGAARGAAYAGQLVDYLGDGEIDPNASYNAPVYDTNAVRKAVSDQIQKKWGPVGSFAYQTAMSMGDFLTASGMTAGTPLALLIMGSGAAADTTMSALERGVDSGSALALGAVAGAAEALTEKISMDALFKGDWDKKAIKYIFKNAFSEGTEEVMSDVINTFADVLIAGDKSEWKHSVAAYMEQGFDEKEAFKKAFLDKMQEIGLDFLGGALSGTVMSGSGVAVNRIGTAAAKSDVKFRQFEKLREGLIEDIDARLQKAADAEDGGVMLPTADGIGESASGGEIVSGLDEPKEIRAKTYDETVLDKKIAEAGTASEKSGLRLGVSQDRIETAKVLSERTGRDVVFYSDTSEQGKKIDGYYDPSSGNIMLNKDAASGKAVAVVLGHELTHTLEQTQAYAELDEMVFESILREGKNPETERANIADLYGRAGITLSDEAIDAEIVAKYVEKNLLNNKAAIRELMRTKPSLVRQIRRRLDRIAMQLAGTESLMDMQTLEAAVKIYRDAEKELMKEEFAAAAPAEAVSADDVMVAKEEAVAETTVQSGDDVSGRTAPTAKQTAVRETVAEEKESSETIRRASDEPLPTGWDEFLERIEALYEAGEITEEERDELYSYVEEARDTGVPFDRASVKIEDIEGKIPAFVRKVREAVSGKTKVGERKYSISEINGENVVVVHKADVDELMNEKGESLPAKVRAYLTRKFRNQVLPVGDNGKAYIRREGKNEYTNPAKRLDEDLFESKMRAASDFDELLAASEYIGRSNDDGRHPEAVRGWDTYRTTFLVEKEKGEYTAFNGDIKVKLIARGDCFYDITNIKDITNSSAGQALIKAAGSIDDVSADSIAHPEEVVNGNSRKYSVSDEESNEKQTLFNTLPTQAMTKLKKAEETFAANLSEMFALNSEKGEPVNIDPADIRAISSGYILNGEKTASALNSLFEKYKTAKSPEGDAYQYGQFGRLADQYENTLKAVKRFADSKKQLSTPKETTERKHYATEEAAKLFEAQRAARRELDRVKARALLTEEDKIAMGKVRRGEMSLNQLDPSEYNADDIRAVLEAQTAFDEADKQIKVYRGEIKAGYMGEAEAALANIADWTDKAQPLAYWRETIDRNFRDIIKDEEKAGEFIRHYIKPVGKAEANRQKMIEDYRERVKALKLKEKPADGEKVSESYAVQLLGEAEDNIRILEKMRKPDAVRDGRTLDEWRSVIETMWTENPSLDQAKIRDGVEAFRVIYDELLKQMNEVLLRNGYAPVRYRSGYFPHFTIGSEDAVLAKFSRLFGINLEVNPLPTSINGLTQDFKPGKTWFSHALERTGFETAYDAVAGFEQYIGGVSDVIHHTDNIQRLRALTSQIRWLSADEGLRQQVQKIENDENLSEEQKQDLKAKKFEEGRFHMSNLAVYLDEYTNRLANKKTRIDRGLEQLIGRKYYTIMNNLESRVAANMIGFNIGSALTNIIPLNQAQALIGPKYTLRGMWDALQNLKNNDGLAAQSDFLASRRGSDRLGLTGVEKFSNIAGMPMELVDNIVSEAIVRAAYLKNLESGMSEDAALEDADAVAASLMADRSKGALPLIFDVKNPFAKLLTQFQVEVNNEFSVIFKDIPRRFKEKGLAKLAAVLLQYFFGAKIFNDIYEKVLGRRPAFDPIEMLNDAVGGLTGYQLPNVLDIFKPEAWNPGRENPADVITDLGTAALESLPFVGGVLGGGRVPIQSALPDVGNVVDAVADNTWSAKRRINTLATELLKPAAYLVPPAAGGLMKKALGTTAAAIRGGVYGVKDVEQDDGSVVGEDVLKYPFYRGSAGEFALNTARSLMSGTSTTTGGAEWVESGFKGLSRNETQAYELMLDAGEDQHAAWDLLQSMKKAEADKAAGVSKNKAAKKILRESGISDEAKAAVYTIMYASDLNKGLIANASNEKYAVKAALALMDISDIPDEVNSKTAEICRIIADADLDYRTALSIYEKEVSKKHGDKIFSVMDAGMTFDDYLRARSKYAALDNSGGNNLDKTADMLKWIDRNYKKEAHRAVLQDVFDFRSAIMMPASESSVVKNYKAMIESGMSEDRAYEVASAVSALEPLEGKSTVSAAQRARAVLDTVSDDEERASALAAVLKDDYRKYGIAHDLGVGFDVYTSFRETLPSYDADGNSSYSQAEIVNAIESLTGAISPEEMIALLMSGQPIPSGTALTDAQKAVLWQLATGSKSAKNNPYSTSAGNKVIEMLGRAE